MKILKEFLMLAAFAIGGYILYRIYLAVTGAASAVAGTAGAVTSAVNSLSPASIVGSVAQHVSDGFSDVGDFLTGGSNDQGVQTMMNQAAADAGGGDYYGTAFFENAANPYSAAESTIFGGPSDVTTPL